MWAASSYRIKAESSSVVCNIRKETRRNLVLCFCFVVVGLLGRDKCTAVSFNSNICDCYLKVVLQPDKEIDTLAGFYYEDSESDDEDSEDIVWDSSDGPDESSDWCDGVLTKNDNKLAINTSGGDRDGCEITAATSRDADTGPRWYYVSSSILKASSQYLQEYFRVFTEEAAEKIPTLLMGTSEGPAFRTLMEFMHGVSAPSTTESMHLSQVLMVADKFEVAPWIKACREELVSRFRTLRQPELMYLPLAVVKEILRSDSLEVQTEDEVFRFAVWWALGMYPARRERRRVLDLAIGPLIRFCYMSSNMLQSLRHDPRWRREYFSSYFIWTQLKVAIDWKKNGPGRQGGVAERAYLYKPILVFHKLEPCQTCTIYLRFMKDQCSRLASHWGLAFSTEPFEFFGGHFVLRARCTWLGDKFCFGLAVVAGRPPEHDYFFCTVASRPEGEREYVVTHAWEFEVRLSMPEVYEDVFRVPWEELMGAGSRRYFDEGMLYMQVVIEAIQTPKFALRTNKLRIL